MPVRIRSFVVCSHVHSTTNAKRERHRAGAIEEDRDTRMKKGKGRRTEHP